MASRVSLRERKKADRRQRIFDAAMRLFEDRGFQATTFDAIARAAEVSRGTVFNYFPYKEAILIEYFGLRLEALRQALQDRREQHGAAPVGELFFLFDALARFVESHRRLVLPLSYELLNPDPERSRAAYLALPLGDLLLDVLARARQEGSVREDYSRERLARTLANVYFITVMQWAAYRQDRSIRDELRTALTLTLEGIAQPR
ncbi:MAG TPA: helix-turn-helix domain-containing protein [Trueperaceae bacterium]|nr:helix-turn-helix domain-containing protein [Trueperaceae bacterium]